MRRMGGTDSIETRIMKRAAVDRWLSGPRQPRKVGPTSARNTASIGARPPRTSSAAFSSLSRSRFSARLRVTNNSAINSSLEPKW